MSREFHFQLKALEYFNVDKAKSKKERNMVVSLQVFHLLLNLYFGFTQVTFIALNYNNVFEISECISPISTLSITIVKFYILFVYHRQFYDMIDEIKEMNGKWKSTPHWTFIQKANDLSDSVTKIFTGCAFIAALCYALTPLSNDFINYFFLNTQPSYEMPFKSAFFYDIKKSPAYEITYLAVVYWAFIVVCINITIDTIFFTCCLNVCAHFEILRKIVNEIELKEFIEYHCSALLLSKKLNTLFKEIVFTEYLIMTILLCVDGFQMIEFDEWSKKFNAFFHTATALIDLCIYSYGGSRIMDCASSVSDENEKLDKNYLMVIAQAQVPVKIETGFFSASLQSFCVILNRVVSLITLLQSFI